MKDGWAWVAVGVGVLFAVAGGGVLVSGAFLSADQIANLARNAGFFGNDVVTATAIALAESSGNPKALGDIGIGQGSFGLWQINSFYHPEFGPDFTTLFNPQVNANAAYSVYLGSGGTFKPWSTFNSGAYLDYLAG